MAENKYERFRRLTFSDFRQRAADASMSCYEKIGFPDSCRGGKESLILRDIIDKMSNLNKRNRLVLDIGPGCSPLPLKLIEVCRQNGHQVILIDSEEMLRHIPDEPFIHKIPGRFPECVSFLDGYAKRVDAILVYSVLHHVYLEANYVDFLDNALALLAEGGEMLIGDIPNISKRRRFLSSARGIKYHRELTGEDADPKVEFNTIPRSEIDDAVIISVLLRCRNAGFDAYVVPQQEGLPMANRREDILVRRP